MTLCAISNLEKPSLVGASLISQEILDYVKLHAVFLSKFTLPGIKSQELAKVIVSSFLEAVNFIPEQMICICGRQTCQTFPETSNSPIKAETYRLAAEAGGMCVSEVR